MTLSIQQIVPEDVALMEALLATFGEAFDEVETYRN
jgi:aminoglycoside 3-N-acetyltransferase I